MANVINILLVGLPLISLGICQSNNPPSLNDPFPQNPGPEPRPTTLGPYLGCPAACATRLEDAMKLISDLEFRVRELNITLTSRLNTVPTGGGTGLPLSPDIPKRVSDLEVFLPGNITVVTNKITNDLAHVTGTLSADITDVRNYIDGKINQLQTSPTQQANGIGSSGQSSTVYTNITARLDLLENVKVQTLINENNVWRKNFEVVNKTFSKMRKSSYSNDVIVVG